MPPDPPDLPDLPAAPAPAAVSVASVCLNCGHGFSDLRPRFCPDCGQETHIKPPTLMAFLQQFGGAYLSTEGALWRTLKLLLFRPGELTVQYLAGRRKHYVLPLRLYLTISLLVLLLLRMVAHTSIEAPDAVQLDGRGPGNGTLRIGAGHAGLKDGVFFCEDLPPWLCKRIQRRIDLKPEALVSAMKQLGERFVANLGAAMFLVLPGFALWLKLVYINRRLRYTEHLVMALHLHAFWFLMFGLTLAPGGWLTALAMLAVPAYTWLALRRVYGGRAWPRLLRATLVASLYLLTLVLAVSGLAIWAFLA
jgi:Protein of unknown function (DUF3667)